MRLWRIHLKAPGILCLALAFILPVECVGEDSVVWMRTTAVDNDQVLSVERLTAVDDGMLVRMCLEERAAAPRSDLRDRARVMQVVRDKSGIVWWECCEAGLTWSLQRREREGESGVYTAVWQGSLGQGRSELTVPNGVEFLDSLALDQRLAKGDQPTISWVVPAWNTDRIIWTRQQATQLQPHSRRWQLSLAGGERTAQVTYDEAGVWASEIGQIGTTTYRREPRPPDQQITAVWRPAFRHQGAGPNIRTRETYQLDPRLLAVVTSDPWQRRVDDVVEVQEDAAVSELAAGQFLGDGPGLSLDHVELRRWAERIAAPGCCASTRDRVLVLAQAVRTHLQPGASASALSAGEAFDGAIGDCTEAANLTCAGLRVVGIPARVVVGLAYRPGFNGWEGHAWCMAYDHQQQRWLHVDATGVVRRRTHAIALLVLDDGLVTTDRRAWDLLAQLGSGTITCRAPLTPTEGTKVADENAQERANTIGMLLNRSLPVHRRRQAMLTLLKAPDVNVWSLVHQIANDEQEDVGLRALAREQLARLPVTGETIEPGK